MNNKQIKFLLALSLALMASFAVLAAGLSESDDATTDPTEELQGLVDAGGTVVLEKDYDISAPILVSEGLTITIDLNGHKIYNTADIWNTSVGNWSLFTVKGGILTIRDSQWVLANELTKAVTDMTSGLIAKANDCYAIDIGDEGVCQIESGNYIGNVSVVYVYDKMSLRVTDGLFRIQQLSSSSDCRFTINNYDAYKEINEVSIAGGSFYKFNPADNLADGPGTHYSVSGYTWTQSGDYFNSDGKAVAKVVDGSTISYYKTIDAAIAKAGLGKTIVLLADVSSEATTSIYGNIDLNGYSFTSTGNNRYFYGEWIKNGELVGSGTKTLRIQSAGLAVKFTDVDLYGASIWTSNQATSITFTGCDFFAYANKETQASITGIGIYQNGADVKVYVTNCTFSGTYSEGAISSGEHPSAYLTITNTTVPLFNQWASDLAILNNTTLVDSTITKMNIKETGTVAFSADVTLKSADTHILSALNLPIPASSKLIIPVGTTLTIDSGATITNSGSLINYGTLKAEGTLTNNGIIVNLGSVTGWEQSGNVLNLSLSNSEYGTLTVDEISGSNVTVTAAKTGEHTFSYWTDGSAKDTSATKTFTVSGTASWEAVFDASCTVTFDSQGGSSVSSQTVDYNTAAAEPTEPTRDGYTFAGWYTDTEYGTKFDFTTKLTQDITLYAKWTTVPATYFTVTFMKDASTQYTTVKVESGKMASAPATDPTVAGSRFLGWYTTAGVTTVTAEKFDFSTKITEDITLYAGWIATCTIALPDSVENCTLSETGKKVVSVSEGSFSFDVTPAAGYTAVVTLTQNGEDSDPIEIATTGTVTIYDLTSNVAVYLMIKAADGTYTETSKTVTENTDGTTTVIDTVVETSTSGDVAITETTSTDDEESTATTATATITDNAVALTVETSSTDVAKVTETIVYAITEAAGTEAVDIDVTVSTEAIELPKVILNNDDVKSLTVTVNSGSANSARISIPTDVLYSDDMADTISISVTSSTSKPASSALKGSSAIAAFDLGLTGTNTTEFNSDVSISYDVKLPTGAKNVRAYCIDSNEFINASYRNGTANFSVPHFSAWTIVYDEPVIIIEDDDDILFILEQQKKAREAASSQTTTEDNSGEEATIIIAAAAVAGAMLACAFFAFRRN